MSFFKLLEQNIKNEIKKELKSVESALKEEFKKEVASATKSVQS